MDEPKGLFVKLTVEGDLWRTPELSRAAQYLASEFLDIFYNGLKKGATLAELNMAVKSPYQSEGYLISRLDAPGIPAKLNFEYESTMDGENVVDLRYNDEEGGLINPETGKKYQPPIKVQTQPVVDVHLGPPFRNLLRNQRLLLKLAKELETDERYMVTKVDNRRTPAMKRAMKKALQQIDVEPTAEYTDLMQMIYETVLPESIQLYCIIHFNRSMFYLGRGPVEIDVMKASADSGDDFEEDKP